MLRRLEILSKNHPYVVQGLVAGSLQVVGDVICQTIIEKKKKVDSTRCCEFFGLGFLTGIVLHKWYRVLDSNFRRPRPFANAVSKVAANQCLFSPIFLYLSVGFIGLLKSGDWREVGEMIDRELAGILIADIKLWPVVQFVNFYFMPLHLQVAFNSAVAVVWNTYFSMKTYGQETTTPERRLDEEKTPINATVLVPQDTFLTKIK